MVYAYWLWGLAVLFTLLERIWPRVRRPWWRPDLGTDFAYLIFNSEYLGLLLGLLTLKMLPPTGPGLPTAGVLASLPIPAQLAAILIGFDFTRW